MDYGAPSDYLVERWLSEITDSWAALHYDNPRIAGAYASEVFGGSYVRCRALLTAPTARASWNTDVLSWSGLPSIMVTHVALWDAQVNGNLLLSSPLVDPIRVQAGGRFDLGSTQFAVSFRDGVF